MTTPRTLRLPLMLALLPLALLACQDASSDGKSDGDLDAPIFELDLTLDADPPAEADGDGEEESAPEEDLPAETDPEKDADPEPDLPPLDGDDDLPDAAEFPDGPEADPDPDPTTPDADPEIEADCPDSAPFDYSCSLADPASCPGGICAYAFCIGPVLDPNRYAGCGDSTCDPCETAASCPADCAPDPVITGEKVYENDTTITVWVHGFSNKSAEEMESEIYGHDRGCDDIFDTFRALGIDRPCGDTPEGNVAPNQFAKVEYYGGIPPDWMEEADIAEIAQYPYSGATALHRYALIVAKFIRHKIEISQATHVNMTCHSMGCYITRYIIENNIEGLAGENRFVRWYTSTGVIAGARLARLYDNPQVREGAELIGLELSDFVIMNPDFAMDYTAHWDHKLYEGNSPYFGGMIIHHLTATDPRIQEALGIQLLDLNNPGDEPNDGIMFTLDEHFHAHGPLGRFVSLEGRALPPTVSYAYFDHMTCPDSDASGVLAYSTLFNRRKAIVTLKEVTLKKDRESHALFDGENGSPPAELALEVEVRFSPFINDALGKDVLISERKIAQRSAEAATLAQDATLYWNQPIYSGPVPDAMTEIAVHLKLLEVDWYPRFAVREWAADPDEELISYDGSIPLTEGFELVRENEFARIVLHVQMDTLY